MNLKEQLYILTIAETKSISKAARELHISQPALSKYLINLEKSLGHQLFDKANNKYIPTYFGSRYLYYAKKIMEIQNQWENESSQLLKNRKGELIISIPIMRSSVLLTNIIPNFIEKYPSVNVILKEETHNLNVDLFDHQKFDFAIYNPSKFLDTYCYESLVVEDLVIITDYNNKIINDYEKGKISKIDLRLFEDEKFILFPSALATGNKIRCKLKELGIVPKVQLVTRNTELAISSAARGEGITFAPISYARKFETKYPIKYAPINEKTELFCVYRTGKFITEYARYFIDSIKEYYKRES